MVAIALIQKNISSTITYNSICVTKLSAPPEPVSKYSPVQQNNIAITLIRDLCQHYVADLEQICT